MDTNKIPIISGKEYNMIAQGYYGGLVDVYRPYGENLYYYDVNSLYPTAMVRDMPCGIPVFTNDKASLNLDTFFGFCYAEIIAPDIVECYWKQGHS